MNPIRPVNPIALKRLLVSGVRSGSGKTTVTLALLAALKARGENLTVFKCGPDYLDTLFHRRALGLPAYNLDPFFLDEADLAAHLAGSAAGSFALIEGAMGFYDGIAATSRASAYQVAKATKTPVVLVVDASGAAASLGAVIKGFTVYRPDHGIGGVIFNRAGAGRRRDLAALAEESGLKPLGFLPNEPDWVLPSRHLGLFVPEEIGAFADVLSSLARTAAETLDLDVLAALAESAPPLARPEVLTTALSPRPGSDCVAPPSPRLAVARDEAFLFLYEENLDVLASLGCELVFFSPIGDETLPPGISGLYLPGGYPELHAEALSNNVSMRESIRVAVAAGLPTIAEGGGFMYLHESIGEQAMCGLIEGSAYETGSLRQFGYETMTAKSDNLLCRRGESIRARSFHYWDSTSPGSGFSVRKAGRDLTYEAVHAGPSLYAGFPQLYFPGCREAAARFVERINQFER